MTIKSLTCEDCKEVYLKETSDYDIIYQTGYCGECLIKRVENGEEY